MSRRARARAFCGLGPRLWEASVPRAGRGAVPPISGGVEAVLPLRAAGAGLDGAPSHLRGALGK